MSGAMLSRRPQSVLFACTFNAVRSPMAEALARHHFGRDVYFISAGVRPGVLDPFAVSAMDEIGIDISKHKPRVFADLEDEAFDAIVSLSPEAHHSALEYTRTMAVDVVYWPTIDPTAATGSREQMLDAYRNVRDGLQKRIMAMMEPVAGGRRII
jgi:protein-tyrosine-phosphatase